MREQHYTVQVDPRYGHLVQNKITVAYEHN